MHSPSILLVEDNPDDEALALRAFRKSKISSQIQVVRDGAEALNYLFAQGPYAGRDIRDLPAVMLLDLSLPKIDGKEVLRQVRDNTHTKRLPVVILTSSTRQEDLKHSYDLGANSYVQKPVDFNEFVGAVSQLGVYWLLLNEVPA